MAVWQYALLFLTVAAGGWVATSLGGRGRRGLPLLLSFSGAYILAVVALELLPEAYHATDIGAGSWLLGGFVIQLLLENLSQGVEHGHVHAHREAPPRYALQIMVGLGLHAFLEGLPLGSATGELHAGHDHGQHLFYGILLHKLPAAFALGLLLVNSDYSARFFWICLLVFAALSPLGALTGTILSIDDTWHARIIALVIGSFLHISTTILFEADAKDHSHRISWAKLGVILLGIAVAYVSVHQH